MSIHSIDVTYAYAQLGLAPGALPEEIEEVLAHARAYQYATRARIKEVERFVEFFTARDQLGDITTPFAFIRRAYHKKAMMLHPDRNSGNKAAEEQLKLINAAFAIIDIIHREARDYYRQNENVRQEIEDEARLTTERETPPDARAKRKARKEHHEKPHKAHGPEKHEEKDVHAESPTRPEIKYVAASIPRFIRTARLAHVPVNCIIASWHVEQENDLNYIFDIIMLPEREFLRARMYLSTPNISPALQRGAFVPSYIPKDIKSVTVPAGEHHPERYARDYFLKEFGVEGKSK